MRGKTLLVLAGLLGAGLLGYRYLPPHLNPLAPLALDDPPGLVDVIQATQADGRPVRLPAGGSQSPAAYRQPAGGRQRGKLPAA